MSRDIQGQSRLGLEFHLSVHKISIAPKSCMALSFLITTFFMAIMMEPFARTVLIIIGASQVSINTNTQVNTPASSQSPSVKPLDKKTMGTMTSIKRIQEPRNTIHLPFKRSRLIIGVQSLLNGPIMVSSPTAKTTPLALPDKHWFP